MAQSDDQRRHLGAWYTPPTLVAHVVAATVPERVVGRVTVLDPACGDGRFLVEAARVVRLRGGEPDLIGIDIDPDAVESARRRPELAGARLVLADALADDSQWTTTRIDIVIGNPPFLSPLSARVRAEDIERGTPSSVGAYTDIAVRFLERAVRHVRADGGRIGLVMPISLLATRDARHVRRLVGEACRMRWFWWSPSPVFDAAVITCAVGLERVSADGPDGPDGRQGDVARTVGAEMVVSSPVRHPHPDDDGWGDLIADDLGLSRVDGVSIDGSIGERARCAADFRDQYYGIIDAVVDLDPARPRPSGMVPLVTTGIVDPGRCLWGERPVRYARHRWIAPAVELDRLDQRMRGWADDRLVPKVLVATQTVVLEAVADTDGSWLPAVPMVSVMPYRDGDVTVEEIAAVLTSPVPSAIVARRAAGTGLSPRAVRVTARQIAALPWPAGPLGHAVEALRSGRIDDCAELVTAAYGVTAPQRDQLMSWWRERRPR